MSKSGPKARRTPPQGPETTKPSESTITVSDTFDFFASPESSNIKFAFYWPYTDRPGYGSMDVGFKDGVGLGPTKSMYTYENVVDVDWHAWKAAESKGKHFFASIRPVYHGVRI